MFKFANLLIMGDEEILQVEGEPIFQKINDAFYLAVQVLNSKVNYLTMGLFFHLGLIKERNEQVILMDKIYKEFGRAYQKRLREIKTEDLTNSVIDKLIKYNIRCKEEGREEEIMSEHEIVSNLYSF